MASGSRPEEMGCPSLSTDLPPLCPPPAWTQRGAERKCGGGESAGPTAPSTHTKHPSLGGKGAHLLPRGLPPLSPPSQCPASGSPHGLMQWGGGGTAAVARESPRLWPSAPGQGGPWGWQG